MKKIISACSAILILLSLFCLSASAQTSPCDVNVNYSAHIQDMGDTNTVSNGDILGTTGLCRRMEALRLSLSGNTSDLSVEYQAHVEDIGWQNAVSNGATAGTTGQCKRMEAIRIHLVGTRSNDYDIYYRTHIQDYGWMGWTSNGKASGSEGYAKRIEAIQVQVVPKGTNVTATGPNSNSRQAFVTTSPFTPDDFSSNSGFLNTKIMGNSGTTAGQLVSFYKENAGINFPDYYLKRNVDLNQFAQMYVEECNAENVRVDIAFCQAMVETGFLKFGGDVNISQFNFAGLGATGGGVLGENFAAKYGDNANGIRMGIRAQIQHLKAYASTEPLNQNCVDSRFDLVTRGKAKTLAELSGNWAADKEYAKKISNLLLKLY